MMRDDSPYYSRPPKEIEREVACMREIMLLAPEVDTVYEAFGGIGATAKAMADIFPHAQFVAYDIDAQCCRMYNEVMMGRGLCEQHDGSAGLGNFKGDSLGVVLDFNRFTLLDARGRREGQSKCQLIQMVARREPAWIEITDSSVRYLGTNWRRYGLREKSLKLYVEAMAVEVRNRWGYKLKTWSNHAAATYMLYAR